jgi:hypothetical protein
MIASRLSRTRESIAALRTVLLQPTPEALQAYVPALREEVENFSALTHPTCEEAIDLNGLQQDLAACRKLIDHGLATTRALTGILAAASAGYSPTGEARPLIARGRLSLNG